MAFDVFKEHRAGLGFGDDPRDIGPQVAGIGLAAALSGQAERLARITGREDMNAPTPGPPVEAFEIVPDRCRSHGLVRHPGHESGRCMGFPLDETHSSIAGFGQPKAKVEPAVAGTE